MRTGKKIRIRAKARVQEDLDCGKENVLLRTIHNHLLAPQGRGIGLRLHNSEE